MKNNILSIFEVDFIQVITGTVIIAVFIITVVELITKISVIFGKPVKWVKQNQDDHEKIKSANEELKSLENKHKDDINTIGNALEDFIKEITNKIEQIGENRKNDRAQSLRIQQELTESIKAITDLTEQKTKQLDNVVMAQRELLAEKINEKYKYYISIGGIPEDEYDEFNNLHEAYNRAGGNHHGDAKFNYCIKQLPIIPVETKLKYEE